MLRETVYMHAYSRAFTGTRTRVKRHTIQNLQAASTDNKQGLAAEEDRNTDNKQGLAAEENSNTDNKQGLAAEENSNANNKQRLAAEEDSNADNKQAVSYTHLRAHETA